MSAHFEVEQKYRPTEGALATLPARLAEHGFAVTAQKQQSDIYYTDADRTFIARKICLRLRVRGDVITSLDFRSKTNHAQHANTRARHEVELPVAGAPLATGQALLAGLGYVEYVTVSKNRTCYRSPRYPGLALEWDEVADVGTCIELELLVDDAGTITKAEEDLRALATTLGLTPDMLSDKQYRDLVAEARGIAA